MSAQSTLAAALLDLEEQIRALRLQVESQSSAGTGAEAAPVPWATEWEDQLLNAKTPAAIVAVDLSPIDTLDRGRGHLSTVGDWDQRARLGRALRLGIAAKRGLASGDFRLDEVLDSPLRVRVVYSICLHCPDYPRGCWSKRPEFGG